MDDDLKLTPPSDQELETIEKAVKAGPNAEMKAQFDDGITPYKAPTISSDKLTDPLKTDMSGLTRDLLTSSLIKQSMEQQGLRRQAELEDKAYTNFAAQQKDLIGQANAQLQPFNEFKPPKESIGQLAGMQAAMMLFAGLVGGKGAYGGMAALNAAGSMMKGYADGQKEAFEKAKQEFDEHMRVVQANNSRVMEILRNNMELAKTDLQVATNKAKNDFIRNGQPMIADAIDKAGLPSFSQFYVKAMQDIKPGLDVINSLGGGKERQVADYIVTNNVAPKTAEEMAAVNKYYPNYKAPETFAKSQQGMNERMINATAGAASALEAVSGIKSGTTVGILPYLGTKEGIVSFLENYAGRKLSSDDAKILDVYYTGLARNIAAIEASGAATGLVGLSKTFESLKPMPGDSNYVVAAKLADAKRVIDETMGGVLKQKLLNKSQEKDVTDLLDRIDKAIPYTVKDVNDSVMKKNKSKTPSTIGSETKRITGTTKLDFATPDDVKSAYKANKITKEEAHSILKEKFGFED